MATRLRDSPTLRLPSSANATTRRAAGTPGQPACRRSAAASWSAVTSPVASAWSATTTAAAKPDDAGHVHHGAGRRRHRNPAAKHDLVGPQRRGPDVHARVYPATVAAGTRDAHPAERDPPDRPAVQGRGRHVAHHRVARELGGRRPDLGQMTRHRVVRQRPAQVGAAAQRTQLAPPDQPPHLVVGDPGRQQPRSQVHVSALHPPILTRLPRQLTPIPRPCGQLDARAQLRRLGAQAGTCARAPQLVRERGGGWGRGGGQARAARSAVSAVRAATTGSGGGWPADGHPVGQHPVAALGEHRLRVELHPDHRQLAVPHRHDHVALGAPGDLQLGRHGLRRMVSEW